MTTRSRIIAILVLTTALLVWLNRHKTPPIATTAPPPRSSADPSTASEPFQSPPVTHAGQPRVTESIAGISSQQRQLVLDAIDNLQFAFRDFSASLGSNPVGTNAEITAALFGNNLKQIKLPIPEGSTRNARGELCDPWDSPWFFHQLSGSKMEIRSAGPDRILYTTDDFVR